MRIAIISDIHGNLEALKSTLQDIRKRNVGKIICLGDIIAKGVHPKECIKLVKENCEIIIQGNCDKHFAMKHTDIEQLSEQEQKRINWNQSLITEKDRNYLLNLPFSYEFYMSGSLVRLFHATNRVNNKAVLNVDSIETKYEMFLPSEYTLSNKTPLILGAKDVINMLQKESNELIVISARGGISFLTKDEVPRIELTRNAFVMALTKHINGDVWR